MDNQEEVDKLVEQLIREMELNKENEVVDINKVLDNVSMQVQIDKLINQLNG